jgi:ABC-type transporter Mla subunit MlaD
MNAARALYFRVGLMVLAGIGAIVTMALWIGSDALRQGGETFETYFSESVQGLNVGAAVSFRGVPLGRVEEINTAFIVYSEAVRRLERTDPRGQLIVVRFRVDRGKLQPHTTTQVADFVAAGMRVRMSSQGVTGVNYLEVDFADPRRFPAPNVPWTPAHRVVPAMPSTLTQFQSAAEALLAQLKEADLPAVIAEVRGLFATLREQFTTGEGYAAMVAAADSLRGVDAALKATTPDLVATLSETRRAAEAIRALAEGPLASNTTAATADLRAGLARLPATLAAAEAAARRMDALGADAGRDLPPLLRDLRVTADNLRAITEQMRRFPSQVLFGAPPPREGETAPEPRR